MAIFDVFQSSLLNFFLDALLFVVVFIVITWISGKVLKVVLYLVLIALVITLVYHIFIGSPDSLLVITTNAVKGLFS